MFTASGVRNIELGWKKNRPDETKEQLLPEFHEGEKIDIMDFPMPKSLIKNGYYTGQIIGIKAMSPPR